MKIYIDTNDGFKCCTTDTGGLLEYEEPFFNGKCPEFIGAIGASLLGTGGYPKTVNLSEQIASSSRRGKT